MPEEQNLKEVERNAPLYADTLKCYFMHSLGDISQKYQF